MPLRFTNRILDHLQHTHYRPSVAKTIARDLDVEVDERPIFDEAIELLANDARIEIGRDELLRLPGYPEEVTGVFRLNQRGFGFVIPDTAYRDGDLFVPRGATRDAISRDRVRVKVVRRARRGESRPGRSPFTGQIVEVIERGRDHFVGALFERSGQWFVEPDGKSLYEAVISHPAQSARVRFRHPRHRVS